WSMEVIIDDLFRLYKALEAGTNPPDDFSPEASYADYVREEDELLASETGQALWEWWQDELSGAPEVLNFPFGSRRRSNTVIAGSSLAFDLGESVGAELREFAKRRGLTLFQVLLATYFILLHRQTGQDDILIGSPFSCRNPVRFGRVVGDFVNPLPVRA